MCKIKLKDAHFSGPLHPGSQKCPKFRWKDNLNFGFGVTPRVFTKLMKIPISLLKKLNIRLIFLDNTLIMTSSTDEMTLTRDNLIYMWKVLGFFINIEKPVLQNTQKIELLGMEIDSVEMTLKIPQGKRMRL